MRNTIRLNSVKDVTLIGQQGTLLKLADQIHTTLAAEAKQGDSRLVLASVEGLREGDTLEVQSAGRTDSFSGFQQKFFHCRVKALRDREVELTGKLRYGAPAGTALVRVQNLFAIGGQTSNLTLQGLELDGNRREGDRRVINHTHHCGIFASGPYSYTDGPKPEHPTRIRVLDCRLRHFFHRGIAFYNVTDAVIANCTIEDTGAEAVDFDHFCVNCHALSNIARRCGVGVEINDASDCLVCHNSIEECGWGVHIWRWCKHEWLNRGNVVMKNSIRNARQAGIALGKGTDSNWVIGNTVEGSKRAGLVLDGDACHISANVIHNNPGGGLVVSGARNVIIGNDATNNGDGSAEQQIKITGKDNIVADETPHGP